MLRGERSRWVVSQVGACGKVRKWGKSGSRTWERRGSDEMMMNVQHNESRGEDSEDIDSKGNSCG